MLLAGRPPIRTGNATLPTFPSTGNQLEPPRTIIWELLSALPINPSCLLLKLR